ncbi:hypothetical protein DWZ96_06570 [Clostridium sp. AF36-18BH]|jgi:hypothetical protein|nr:hypothetical protein DWZ96_06570 [Clostridium sp. AF36-18BH]
MFTIIITLLLPLVPIVVWRQYVLKNHGKSGQTTAPGKGEYIFRYLTCLICVLVISWIMLSLAGNDDNTILRKLIESREYAVKVLCAEICIMLLYAIAELFVEEAKDGKHEKIRSVLYSFNDSKVWSVFRKYIGPVVVAALAILVVCLNFSMMSDRVLWGDEAFSANTAHKDVDGILQVLYYWDNHPPLYYYWLKLFGTLFGYKVPVFHLASLVPFVIGIVLALTVVRKHFGLLPATFFVMISGLGQACLEYNLEVRMYALAFLCVMGCFYCSYRVIADGNRKTWAGMVLWALAAAYSHYYALVAVGIMMFFTGVAVWIKYRGKTWIKGVLAIIAFFIGYAPWLYFFYAGLKNVSRGWWMTEILGLDRSLEIVMGGRRMNGIVFPLLILFLVITLVADSSVFSVEKDGIHLQKPSVKKWSDKTYAMAVGACTILGTLVFAYLLSVVMAPMLAQRYLYPLSAVAIVMLVIGSSRVLELLALLEKQSWKGLELLGRVILVVFLGIMFGMGIRNYRECYDSYEQQKTETDKTLDLIGTPTQDTKMVTNGVKHLGWTVLYYYYPDNEIVNGDYRQAEADSFWYFTPNAMGGDSIAELEQNGYQVTDYGQMQLSQYPFFLYYMEK